VRASPWPGRLALDFAAPLPAVAPPTLAPLRSIALLCAVALLVTIVLLPAAAEAQKGPYAIDFEGGEARVMIELPPGETPDADTRARPSPAGPGTLHELRTTEGELTLAGETLTIPREKEDDFAFLVYGDCRTNHDAHRAVVRQMLREEEARFLLHTGDFVEVGGRAQDWQIYFDIAGPLLRRMPLYPSLGNHELYGPGGLRRYHRYFAPHRRRAWDAHTWGPVRIVALDSNDEDLAEQADWLEAELERTAADPAIRFVVALVHHGPVSSGRHGGLDAFDAAGITDLLREHADLVFSGHDHMYERGDADGLKYVVTGGGGAPLYTRNRRLSSQRAFEPVHHYVRVEVHGERMQVRAVRIDGTVIETCGFEGRSPWECEGGGEAGPITEDPGSDAWLFGVLGVLLLALAWVVRRRVVARAPSAG